MNKKYLSFFSGALGLDTGLDEAGFTPLMYNEYDKKIVPTIQANKPDIKLFDCSILDLSKEKIYQELKLKKNEKIFLMAGGPPCQPFSTNGKRLSLLDERGNALVKYLQLILEIQPKYFILENVRGIYSSAIINDDGTKEKPGSVLKYILDQFEQSGYSLNFNLYDMSYYNVPQKRERFVLIGHLGKAKVPTMEPVSIDHPKTVKDAIKHLMGKNMDGSKYSLKQQEIFSKIPMGGNWRKLSLEDQKLYMGNSFNSKGGRTGFFRRLDWNKPSPTLVTSPTMRSTGLCHPEELRPLSVEEYKMLQTFPKDLIIKGSIDYQYKQLGNAVPCNFARLLGEHILKFDKDKKMKSYKGKTSRYLNTSLEEWLENY